MNVQWIVAEHPHVVYNGGQPDYAFFTTAGWCWEEANRVGALGLPVKVTAPPFYSGDADVLVFSTEEAFYACGGADLPAKARLIRVVGAPGDNPVWNYVAANLHKIDGYCCIGLDEARRLTRWIGGLVPAGVLAVPIGADRYGGDAERRGVAWLGRAIPEKRVADVVAACATAGVPLHLGLVMPEPKALQEIADAATKHNATISVAPLGLRARTSLLCSVRCVATASVGDSQWMPGTEIRACGGIALAPKNNLIEQSNGAGLLYFDGEGELAALIRRIHEDDAFFDAERVRQSRYFDEHGYGGMVVAQKLKSWIEGFA